MIWPGPETRRSASSAAHSDCRTAPGSRLPRPRPSGPHWRGRPASRRLQLPDVDLLLAVRGQLAPEELGIRTREYVLAPLVQADARVLLERTTTTLHGYARNTVLRQAAGNPLALVEFGRAVETSASGRLGVSADTPLPLSRRLEAMYCARLRELPPPTRRALLLAAAPGSQELADALASGRILIAPDHWVLAAEAGLVTLETQFRQTGVPAFVHPLMRSAVFQSATYIEQADAHRNLAAALTAYPARRAWHLAQSAWHPDEEVAALLEATAREIRGRASHAAAAAFERAAELSPDPRDACRRLTATGEAAGGADERVWMLRLAERAAAVGTEAGVPAEELAEARQWIAYGKLYIGVDANLVRDLLATLRTSMPETRFLRLCSSGSRPRQPTRTCTGPSPRSASAPATSRAMSSPASTQARRCSRLPYTAN